MRPAADERRVDPPPDLKAVVGSYEARDAVWVREQPLAVNSDFDFSGMLSDDLAMLGLAASQRRSRNEELATALSNVAPIDPMQLLAELCAGRSDRCSDLGKHPRIYGLLFGEHDARLRVFLEPTANAGGAAPVYATVSDARDARDFAAQGVLRAAFETGLQQLLDLLAASIEERRSKTHGRCAAGGHSSVSGELVSGSGLSVIRGRIEDRAMLLACPSSALTSPIEAPIRSE